MNESAVGLGEAIAEYRDAVGASLSRHGDAVLKRLAGYEHKRGEKAFAKLKADRDAAFAILADCVRAEELRRNFGRHVGIARDTDKWDRLDAAVKALRGFVVELEKGPADKLAAVVVGADTADMRRGLYLLAGAIRTGRRIAGETPTRLGATRKAKSEGAATTAAVGWLARAVRKICGEAHYSEVAVLAELALGVSDVISIDRARQGWRTRHKRRRKVVANEP